MNTDENEDEKFGRYALTGLLVGIIAVPVNIIFDILYCQITGFSDFAVINIATIFFITAISLTLGGISFYYFDRIKAGVILYIIVFILITTSLLIKFQHIEIYEDALMQKQFNGLVMYLTVILSILIITVVPLLIKNRKITNGII